MENTAHNKKSLQTEVLRLKKSVDELHSLINKPDSASQSEAAIKILHLSQEMSALRHQIGNLEQDRNKLKALAEIGGDLNSSLDTNEVLQAALDTIIALTGAERSFLMLKNESGETKISIARNWKNETLSEEEWALSTTIVNRVLELGEPIMTTNAKEDPMFEEQESVMYYNMRSIVCVPLKRRNEVIGAIYADNKSRVGQFADEDLSLVNTFANQAAIALDNALLFEDLHKSNLRLNIAYNNTLEGWAHALELRDNVTQGHTVRVTELTVELSLYLDLPPESIAHIRRGALLHDIGKMGVPDAILHKPGKLTDEEYEIMKKHPTHARDMLTGIDFLAPALDIPYSHHEKWDGTGYPLGLKGKEIPLAARIFSVVDVWDAMTSDRPYRAAIPVEEVLEHIESLNGTHFDPEIGAAFVQLKRYQLSRED